MSISIIIPTYKPSNYLKDCLQSLENQSCSLNNFEVIIVLNGEKEPYYKLITEYLNNSRLRYKKIYTEIKGVSNARNIGIQYATKNQSQYILFLDDDDKLSSSFITDCLSKANPSQILVCNSKTFKNNNDITLGEDYITRCYNKNKNKKFNTFRYRCFFSSICAKLIPINIIGDIKFNSKFSRGEDSLFGFEILKRNVQCILSEENTIYLRRLRQGSVSRSKINKLESINNQVNLILAYSAIFFKKPMSYNFTFYVSRVFASFKNMLNTMFR